MKKQKSFYKEIYEKVCAIPKGKVATYGQIAMLCGRSNASRVVGYALHKNPCPQKIPCHRVVFKDGSLSKAFAFGGANEQERLLSEEGVEVVNQKVNLQKHLWMPKIINEGDNMDIVIRKLKINEQIPYELLLDADPNREIVDSYLKRGETYIAEHEKKAIGVYVIIPTRPETYELVNVAVSSDYQGKGIGKMLVKHAIETVKNLGAASIELGTGNPGFLQIALYQKCGFRIVGVDLDFFTRHYKEKIIENGLWCRDMIRFRIDFDE